MKRFVCFILVLTLILTLAPTVILAEGDEAEEPGTIYVPDNPDNMTVDTVETNHHMSENDGKINTLRGGVTNN